MKREVTILATVGNARVVCVIGHRKTYAIEYFKNGDWWPAEHVPLLSLLLGELSVDPENEKLFGVVSGLGLPEFAKDWMPDV